MTSGRLDELSRLIADLLRIAQQKQIGWVEVLVGALSEYAEDLGPGAPSDQDLENLVDRLRSIRESNQL